MDALAILRSLILLTLANGAPVVAKKAFGRRLAAPLDGGVRFFDRRPLLGPSKTVRGVLAAILASAAGAPLLGLDPGPAPSRGRRPWRAISAPAS